MKINLTLVNKIFKYQLIILVGIFLILDICLFYHLYNLWQSVEIVDKKTIQRSTYISEEKSAILMPKKLIYPIAVIIDNHIKARPNYGLSTANIVYETPVEGGVTRFLALYTTQKTSIDKIGPVRSARPYLVEIAKEYDALLAHAGGSPQALELIEKLKIHNLEEIAWWGPEYFWRVHSRQAPHNLFTSSKKLLKALIDWELDKQTPIYHLWPRQNPDLSQAQQQSSIKILFSPAKAYQIEYKYQPETKKYLRFQDEQEHVDALNGEQISVDNLIIQFIPAKKIMDGLGRVKLNLTGQGKAWVFINGQSIPAKWAKTSTSDRTIFYSQQNGKEIKFKPGNIWIEIVPEDIKVNW